MCVAPLGANSFSVCFFSLSLSLSFSLSFFPFYFLSFLFLALSALVLLSAGKWVEAPPEPGSNGVGQVGNKTKQKFPLSLLLLVGGEMLCLVSGVTLFSALH